MAPRCHRCFAKDGTATGWNRGPRAKKSVADGGHVAVIGHVTVDELRTRLTENDRANGFANRHLLALVRRSRLLPTGGTMDEAVIVDFGRRTRDALLKACKVGIVGRTARAEDLWDGLYREMADDEPSGLLGAIIARDQAQVLPAVGRLRLDRRVAPD